MGTFKNHNKRKICTNNIKNEKTKKQTNKQTCAMSLSENSNAVFPSDSNFIRVFPANANIHTNEQCTKNKYKYKYKYKDQKKS
jgi:hypothetical protein